MICVVCQKKEAVVHYAEVVEGEIKKLDLCEECALEKGIGTQTSFSMSDLIAGMSPESEKKSTELVCENCQMTMEEFRKTGRLGCHECYSKFSDSLASMIEQIHRAKTHKGKKPVSVKMDPDEEKVYRTQLEKELKEAVSKENFEKAAFLRDEIKKLNNEN